MRLLEQSPLEADGGSGYGRKHAAGAVVDVSNFFGFASLSRHPPGVAQPELVIVCSGDEAAFVQKGSPGVIPLRLLEIEVSPPIAELIVIKFRNVEIRSLDLRLKGPSFSRLRLDPVEDIHMVLIDACAEFTLDLGRVIACL